MSKRPFDKPAKTYVEQIDILKGRGLIVEDQDIAAFYLQHLNYYRLGAYWLPFEATHSPHKFKPNTTFNDVINLYIFDRELRLLIMDAIERIEVSVRAKWAYCMSHHHGPHGYLEQRLAVNAERWQRNKDDLLSEIERSDEIFIRHLRITYSEEFPPVWAACEVMSLGLLSRWYNNLKPTQTRGWIAKAYGTDQDVLASWLHHLSIIRNLCAHHSRLWNREIAVLPKRPKNKPRVVAQEMGDARGLYNTLIILLYMMDVIAPQHDWRDRLRNLLNNHTTHLTHMGFPKDWQNRPLWNI